MKTVGELYDALNAIRAAEKDVDKWERAIERAYAEDTRAIRQEGLEHAEWWLNHLRSERLDGTEE